jgi:hypothetical protein
MFTFYVYNKDLHGLGCFVISSFTCPTWMSGRTGVYVFSCFFSGECVKVLKEYSLDVSP